MNHFQRGLIAALAFIIPCTQAADTATPHQQLHSLAQLDQMARDKTNGRHGLLFLNDEAVFYGASSNMRGSDLGLQKLVKINQPNNPEKQELTQAQQDKPLHVLQQSYKNYIITKATLHENYKTWELYFPPNPVSIQGYWLYHTYYLCHAI